MPQAIRSGKPRPCAAVIRVASHAVFPQDGMIAGAEVDPTRRIARELKRYRFPHSFEAEAFRAALHPTANYELQFFRCS
jgi:hypothetical protein